MMPDMMPHVSAGSRPGVFYNTGHGHLGWTLSAATAQMVADLVDDARPIREMPLAPLVAPANDVGPLVVAAKSKAVAEA